MREFGNLEMRKCDNWNARYCGSSLLNAAAAELPPLHVIRVIRNCIYAI